MPLNNPKGEFVRPETAFRNRITADGSSGFKAAIGRYHLYVSLACPWAHRTLLLLGLKGLNQAISHTVVDWLLVPAEGWKFTDSKPKCTLDTVNNCQSLREIYNKASPDYSGRVSVPVLWDKERQTIVNNESAEIIEMLNSEFNEFAKHPKLDLYPSHLREQIDATNDFVYTGVNNAVYRCGFASSQDAYDVAVVKLFETLDELETRLSKTRYLVGNQLTLADVRLFTTLVRFDWVYVGIFKCDVRRLTDYPNLWAYCRDLFQTSSIAETVDKDHIRNHYWQSLKQLNPNGIVPRGPNLDFLQPHGREKLSK